jgi:hypothetical protein
MVGARMGYFRFKALCCPLFVDGLPGRLCHFFPLFYLPELFGVLVDPTGPALALIPSDVMHTPFL